MTMDIAAIGGPAAVHAVSGASYAGPPNQKMANLFDSIDTNSSGSINQAQFNQAFQTKNPPGVFKQQGADAIFSALDPTGSGSVSRSDFVATMSQLMAQLRAAPAPSAAGPASSATASLQSLNLLV